MNAPNERCPNCGSMNLPQARFCGSCGSPLSAVAAEPQRGGQTPEPPRPEDSKEAAGRDALDLESAAADGLRLARKAARFVQEPINLNVASPARWQVVVGDLPPSGPAALAALGRAVSTEARRAASRVAGDGLSPADAADRPLTPPPPGDPARTPGPRPETAPAAGPTRTTLDTPGERPPAPPRESGVRRPASQAPPERPARSNRRPQAPPERPPGPPEMPASPLRSAPSPQAAQSRRPEGPARPPAPADQTAAFSGRPQRPPERPPRPPEAAPRRPQAAKPRPATGAGPAWRPAQPSAPPERPPAPPEGAQMGSATVSQAPDPEERSAPLSGEWGILLVSGPGAGQRFPLGPRSTIGRSEKNTIQLDDEQASRDHAVIMRSNEGVSLQDLGSTNGTQVNGRLTRHPVTLESGDRVRIGNTVLQVIRSGRATAPSGPAGPTRCTNCGVQIPPGASFCGACGHPVV